MTKSIGASILILQLAFFFSFISESNAQKWIKVDKEDFSSRSVTRQIIPEKYEVYHFDLNQFKNQTKAAPQRFQSSADGIVVTMPLPEGQLEKFSLKRNDVFHPELAAKYPEIQSYTGFGLDDPTAVIKISLSHKGMHGMILSSRHNTIYIDKYAEETMNDYIVYDKKDFYKHLPEGAGHCEVEHPDDGYKGIESDARFGDCQLRKFRLALACTGEYANFHGGNVPDVLAEYNASMNRINGVYERDFGIVMELIPNTDELIYFNSNTDPYTNNDGFAMLTENQNTIDAVIGFQNYDIGHVFSTGGGGVASLRSPCTTRRARGVTGLPNPSGDPFWIDFAAHEMGHQFGGNHTQNNNCQRNTATAMEPGSASTIMGYAGICTPNVQNNSDDYFHAVSQQEVANFVVAGNGNCAEILESDNTGPELENLIGNNHILPIGTPFSLTAEAIDADNDILTYCWEQMDNESASMPPVSSAVVGPAFRSYNPTESPTRFFPRLSSILTGSNANTWEALPSVNREMNFNITVRDNQLGNGCTANDDLTLTFSEMAGPFSVTSQNETTTWNAGSTESITWDVANTDQAPVSCATVDIWLSVDGGDTFDILLADNVANDGEETIVVPSQFSSTCRLMVKSATSVFLDINDRDFTILAPFSISVSPSDLSVCKDQTATFAIDFVKFGEEEFSVTFELENLPAGASFEFSPSSVTEDQVVNLTISDLESIEPGSYDLVVKIVSDVLNSEQNITLNIGQDEIIDVVLLSPNDAQTNVGPSPILSWESQMAISDYTIELSKNPAFNEGELLIQTNTQATFITTSVLETETVYYWRVRSNSMCFESQWGDTQSFQTSGQSCQIDVIDVNAPISATSDDLVQNTFNIESTEVLSSTEVSLLINHSWVGDLSASLQAPNGTTIQLFDQVGVPASTFGCGEDNLSLNFSDNASFTADELESVCSGNDFALEGTYQSVDMLSLLNGQLINGDWTITIEDAIQPDGGTFVQWSLTTCSANILLPGTLLVNNPLVMQDVVEANITNGLLSIEQSDPANSDFILRSTPKSGIIELLDEMTGIYSPLTIGGIFTQEDIDTERVRYRLTAPASVSDAFMFDTNNDLNQYTSNNTFNINSDFSAFSATASIVDEIACFGDENGSIAILPAAGVTPYTYSIDGMNFVADSIFTGLPSGTYSPVTMDASGATFAIPDVNISQPDQLLADLVFGSSDVTVNASGGTGDYSYSLDGTAFSSIPVITLFDGQSYTIYVRDENDCEIVLPEFTHYFISAADITILDVDCKGDASGSLEVNGVTGGLAPYTYEIDGQPNPDNVFQDLVANIYTIRILDASGVEFTTDITVTEPDEDLSLVNAVDESTITLDANGGTSPYTYSLDDVNYTSNNIFEDLDNGTYTGYTLDANGCLSINENIIISITSTVDPVIDNITVYPNPASNMLNIGNPTQIALGYSIIDLSGRKIRSGNILSDNSLSLNGISDGAYILRLNSNESFKYIKLIVIQ